MLRNNLHVVGMPPSSYRPSPPSSRPPPPETYKSVLDELLAEHAEETEAEPVAAKKKKKKRGGGRSPESIAKQKATIAAKKKAAQAETGKTLVSSSPSPRAGKPQKKNTAEIQLTGVQAWLRAELEAMKPELRRLVREELRAMLAGG